MKRERYLLYKAQGRCPNCGKPAPDTQTYCEACLSRKRVIPQASICEECGVVIPPSETKRKKRFCPSCAKERNLKHMRGWYAALSPERRQARRNYETEFRRRNRAVFRQRELGNRWKRLYHIGLDTYLSLFHAQGGKCACCKAEFPDPVSTQWKGKLLVVDHCHEQGHVRGLLCANCNAAIGFIKDSPATALSMHAYLLQSSHP